MNYKKFITYEDILSRGYDLKTQGRLEQGDFYTIDAAIEQFLKESFDSVYDLIESYKGVEWTEKFFEDMSTEIDSTKYPEAYRKQSILRWAILEQTIFYYENGDIFTSSKIEIDKIGYSPKAVKKLWGHNLLG